ncbi:PIG-L deacetylase family protein [Xanthomonas axonopodis]
MGSLRGGHIEGQGISEARWLASRTLTTLPRIRLDQLIGSAARLVVVSPHPDDEVLGCGGLLAMAAADGMDIVIVSVTDGEAAYPGEAAWPPPRLAAARRQELHEALACLGIDPANVVRIEVGDGQVQAHGDVLAARLAALIRPTDAVFVTYAGDGHPDHEACADAAISVAAACGARLVQYPVWAWHWDDPENSTMLASATRLVLTDTARAAKATALAAFKTQTGEVVPRLAEPILPDWALARFQRDFEVYIA